jgi:predicted glutamine amidotransferase
MVAARPVSVCELLHLAPRSLAVLSHEHPDGWGIAVQSGDDWQIQRSTNCAAHCGDYAGLADIRAEVLIAHVRKATVGSLSIENTHPFQRGRFVFAHNGTVHRIAELRSSTSPAHLARVAGQTDSEQLFAFVLTQIDETGDVDRGVARAVSLMQSLGDIGAATFLFSGGGRLFAYRSGRTLYTLDRGAATFVASEPLTDEPWREVPQEGLVVLERPQMPSEPSVAA